MAPTTIPPIPPFFLKEMSRVKPGPWCLVPGPSLQPEKVAIQRAKRGSGLGTPLTSAIWISSGSSRGWLGPLARLRFWWAGHMFCRRWLCICLRCFLHRGRIGEPSMAPPKGRNSLAVLPGRLGNAQNLSLCTVWQSFGVHENIFSFFLMKIFFCLHL